MQLQVGKEYHGILVGNSTKAFVMNGREKKTVWKVVAKLGDGTFIGAGKPPTSNNTLFRHFNIDGGQLDGSAWRLEEIERVLWAVKINPQNSRMYPKGLAGWLLDSKEDAVAFNSINLHTIEKIVLPPN